MASVQASTPSTWGWRLRHLEPPLWALAGLTLAPLALLWGGAVPPWPGGVALLTCLANLGLALALGRLRSQHVDSWSPRTAWAAGAVAVLAALLFLVLLSRFTFTIPSTGEVGVKGLTCTAEARLVYPLTCPDDDLEALRSAEYESTRIWQPWSVDLVRVGLLAGWTLGWAAVCLLIASLARAPFRALIESAPPVSDAAAGYFFVSYAHADLHRMLPVLDGLHAAGYALWFDKGLLGGQDWDTGLALRLQGCRALVLFWSPASAASKWVEREVRLADELGKPIFAVRIGDAAMTPAMRLRIPASQFIEGSAEEIVSQFKRAFPQVVGAGV